MKKEKDENIVEETAETSGSDIKPEPSKKEKKKDKNLEVDKIKESLAKKEDEYLRLYAEYDNYRKRSSKEKQEVYSNTRAEVIKDLLPVIDNFERAAANSDADFEAYKKGVEIIYGQFLKILETNGVEAFGVEGEVFDPNFHSAVMAVEDDTLGENVIAQVFSKGYKLGDKIIREAVVKVANS